MRVLGGLACLLVAVGCAPTESMRWHSLMRAAEQAPREGRATEAEETWRKAIAEVGPDDWRAAPTLERLGRFYEAHGRAKEAEQAYRQTLALREKLRPSGPAVAHSLTDLAHLYHSQGRYSEAEPLYERALPMAEAAFGPTHRNVEVIVSLLANLYANEGKYAEAERLYQRLLAGPNVDSLALGDLALLYEAQRRYSEAEP